jgi:glycerol-3-phosphate dehydrogenase (NAD(P)+)
MYDGTQAIWGQGMRVGILGGGRWGQALARLVLAAGNEPFVAYRSRPERPPKLIPSSDHPPDVSAACELLFVATSASELRSALRLARPSAANRILIAGRGLEPDSGRWLSEVVLEECDARAIGALAGPAPAEEILNGGLCAGVLASADAELRAKATAALHSSRYRVYASEDLAGVEFAGAAMPVLATMIGMVTSLQGAGVGLHAMVVARGLEEMSRVARTLGAHPATLGGLAGIGDLVAVQSRPAHPHFRAGAALARGDRTLGPRALAETLLALAKKSEVETPLLESLVAIWRGLDPLEVVSEMMAREAQPEFATPW